MKKRKFDVLECLDIAIEHKHVMKRRKFDVGECSHVAIEYKSCEGVDDGPILESKHKIFLSHSGVQKEFVEHLCKALEDHCRYPFFDRRRESLPKGKEFPNLIIKAAQQCQLFVVVVSEEYFMSKWPMIELNAFVQAKKMMKINEIVAILPLFYGLSADDLKDEKRRQRWLEKWETFAKDGPNEGQIKVEDWRFALDELMKFNGLPYDRELKEIVAYENDIVSHICNLIPPDVKWDDSHVQGNVHEVLLDKMQQIGLSEMYKVKVVGIYGVGGIGKTTTCKTLCNELSSKYEGRVCHVEFDGTCSNSKESWQNVVVKLTRKSVDFVCQLDEGQCINIFYKAMHKQPTFLAIDNVWDNDNSIKQARMFLKTCFHKDSLVLVTTRSRSTLALLGIDGDACLEMPELGRGQATSLFLYHVAPGKQFTTQEDIDSIDWCVKKCYFCKGDEGDYHYHPLALEALGRQLYCYGKKPSEWVQRLSGVWKSSSFSGENVVFNVLRSSFDLLQPIEQTLFMDVGFFLYQFVELYANERRYSISLKEQLCILYRSELEIQSQLNSLKQKGLLQDVDLESGRITMHDLYREFLIHEAERKLGGTMDMLDRKWVLINGDHGDFLELEVAPPGERWHKLSRLFVWKTAKLYEELWFNLPHSDRPPTNLITRLEYIEWQYFSNVLVLQLFGLKFGHGSLNLKGMKRLRKLQLFYCNSNCLMSLEGLESLKYLASFEWRGRSIIRGTNTIYPHVLGQFPSSLKYLCIEEPCVLSRDNVLVQCNNFIKLKLANVEVGELLDLNNCSSLESLEMSNICNLETISRLSSSLYTLIIHSVLEIHILELNQLDGLVQLEVANCHGWKMSCLLSLIKLEVLRIDEHSDPLGNCIPHQLQKLHYGWWSLKEIPCLNVFKQLQVLDLSRSYKLVSLRGLGDLLALRSLNLSYCYSLRRLPDLSKSKSLEKLDLNCCGRLKLYEKYFEMLASLPLLQPVLFGVPYVVRMFMLDIAGRKVLRSQMKYYDVLFGKKSEWEEPEFVPLPVKFENLCNWISRPVAPHPQLDLVKCESRLAKYQSKRPKY